MNEIIYRSYFFTNMYISNIQRGIQSAHCISDMHMKYSGIQSDQERNIRKWANIDKTMIILNGGYSSHLKEIKEVFSNQKEFAWDFFEESEEALDGALTCVGIILPDYVYDSASNFQHMNKDEKEDYINNLSLYHKDITSENTSIISWLIQNLSKYRLA